MILDENKPNLLIDVRNPIEYEMCHLNNSINIPLKKILEDENIREKIQNNNENVPGKIYESIWKNFYMQFFEFLKFLYILFIFSISFVSSW